MSMTIECPVHFRRARAGQKRLTAGQSVAFGAGGTISRMPRLMTLSIRFDGLVRSGKVRDYAERHLERLMREYER